jgi:DNA-binding LacI/PurR family transcriptional regulator
LLGVGGEHRSDAVRHALADTGIQIVEDPFAGKARMGDGLGDVFDRWRTLAAPPTAVVCGSDRVAVAVLQECKRQDIAVPGQLSVVGYGDTELSRQVRPALSTVRVPACEAGTTLARSLLAQLDARFEPSPELHPKLVVRESTGTRA